MPTNQTLEKLQQLKFRGMQQAFEEQLQHNEISEFSFDERFALLVDREILDRENRCLQNRLKQAKLKHQACVEDIDFKSNRELNKMKIMELADCNWINKHDNIILLGPTGTGKTYIACALAHKACLQGYTSQYLRLPKLFQQLQQAKGEGNYIKFMNQLSKTDILILDDWGLNKFNDEHRRDILEILDERYKIRSTIITSQLPISHWHEIINDPTLADAILDRVIHNSHKIELKGESMRKKLSAENKKIVTKNLEEL